VIAGAKLRRPVLVGWSLGGFVIGAYLRKHGGSDIAGINLVDAVTKLSPDLFTEESGVFARTTMSHDLAERTQATADFLSVCFHQPPSETETRRMLVINGMTSRAVDEGILKTKTADFEPYFRAYAGPILSIHGAHDRLVRIAMSERIQSMDAKNRSLLFPDSGHSPFYDEPVRYGKELAAFVTAADKS
jgi:non-heme chloroperoxidase